MIDFKHKLTAYMLADAKLSRNHYRATCSDHPAMLGLFIVTTFLLDYIITDCKGLTPQAHGIQGMK